MSDNGTHTWPELAIGLYEQLTGKNAEIIYTFVPGLLGGELLAKLHEKLASGQESADICPWCSKSVSLSDGIQK